MTEPEHHLHSDLCHHLERQVVVSEACVAVVPILDGDELRTAQVVNALLALLDDAA